MSAAGDLIQLSPLAGEIRPPVVAQPVGPGGGVFRDFTSRLRGYVAPPPPDQLAWQAVIGVAMILGSAALIALLPAGDWVRHAGVIKWVGRSGLASTMDSIGTLARPLALVAMVVLVGIAAIYITRWGATPALAFLTVQTWLGVAALAIPVFGWGYLLVLLSVNIVIWALWIGFLVACGIAALTILGLFLDS